ncbi:unnamed protein product, partial [Rotaria sordida]
MNRNKFLGTTDLTIVASLLSNYNVPTKVPNGIKLNKVKCQDDLILIELGTLLTSDECDEILSNVSQETFEDMSEKYETQQRNSSRLIVIDDRLARTLWRRLKFGNKLPKLVQNPTPLGFNVQGQWIMSGVNPAMRLNKYKHGEYFAPHKDAQYAPNGDERSLLSLLIYLNDDYEKGETKFYFPKQAPNFDVKGLTIAEEIQSYEQKDKLKREPTVDLDHSVDRAYFTNRHQSQFIGQNLLSRFHFQMRDRCSTSKDIFDIEEDEDSGTDDDNELDKSLIETYERQHALFDNKNKLVDLDIDSSDLRHLKDPALSYCEYLMKQDSGTGLFRM